MLILHAYNLILQKVMDPGLAATSQIISQLCQVFKDPKNPNNVDLVKLRDHINKDKKLNSTHIFKRKLEELKGLDTISAEKFRQKFYPDLTNEQHFNLVFDQIDKDKSGKISKRELQLFNNEAGLGLTKNDIELMISFASKDGQKVYKQDLFRFLNTVPK